MSDAAHALATLATARPVWLDTRLACIACGKPFFGVIPCGDGWTYLTCPHRACRRTWVALTLPPSADGHWLRARLGRRATDALLALLHQRPGQPVLVGAASVSYLQVSVTGREFHAARHEPLHALLDALMLP